MKTHALVAAAVGLIAQGAQLGALPAAGPATAPRPAQTTAARPTIVLVHGGFVATRRCPGASRHSEAERPL